MVAPEGMLDLVGVLALFVTATGWLKQRKKAGFACAPSVAGPRACLRCDGFVGRPASKASRTFAVGRELPRGQWMLCCDGFDGR